MTIKFCGAARAVTGSSHLLTLDDGFSILLDCGLYQGNDNALDNFNNNWYFDPKSIDCMVLSHAHIDHCGRIPKLYKDGFRGSVFCTHATRDLASIMLMDSARIQVRDAEYLNKKSGRYAFGQATALYDTRDVKHSIEDFVGIGYEHWYRIHPNVEILLRDAGHILGSASVVLRIKRADGSTTTFGFSGDIGRPDRPILRDPLAMEQCDYLICESTYGAKWHQGRPDDENTLLKIIKETCIDNQGKLIIPAFSVGRTQEIVYMLDTLETYGKLTQIPVFVDSPLAINATQIFQSHPECFDDELMEYLLFDPNPWGFNRLRYVRRVSDSKKLNQ
ncbi:MAG: MBL fold metallo-hydrolase, partial [Chitinophagales bacterium]